MDARVLELLENLNKDMQSMKSDMGSMKIEMGSMKTEMGSMKTEMHERFDKVDDMLGGIGKHFELQTEYRMVEDELVKKEVNFMKYRIYELENKVLMKTN